VGPAARAHEPAHRGTRRRHLRPRRPEHAALALLVPLARRRGPRRADDLPRRRLAVRARVATTTTDTRRCNRAWMSEFNGSGRALWPVARSVDGARWECIADGLPWAPRGLIGGSAVLHGRMWLIGGGCAAAALTAARATIPCYINATYSVPVAPVEVLCEATHVPCPGGLFGASATRNDGRGMTAWRAGPTTPPPPRTVSSVATSGPRTTAPAGCGTRPARRGPRGSTTTLRRGAPPLPPRSFTPRTLFRVLI
jgi:hypothetical protein